MACRRCPVLTRKLLMMPTLILLTCTYGMYVPLVTLLKRRTIFYRLLLCICPNCLAYGNASSRVVVITRVFGSRKMFMSTLIVRLLHLWVRARTLLLFT